MDDTQGIQQRETNWKSNTCHHAIHDGPFGNSLHNFQPQQQQVDYISQPIM